jgi:hypothetical protein
MDYKSRSSREAHMIINSTSWWTMYIGEAFPKTMHMIQNACNLRYKDAYTSCYICHAKCKKCIKESYTYATKGAPTHQLKKSNKHQTPPANEWKLLDLGVSWKYQLVCHVWVHGSRLSSHSLHSLKKMISHFYVLGFGMEHCVLCNAYGTSAITLKWDMGILKDRYGEPERGGGVNGSR